MSKIPFLLFILIFLGAIAIPISYRKLLSRQQQENRPYYEGRITRNFSFPLIDGKTLSFFQMKNQVWTLLIIDVNQPKMKKKWAVLKNLSTLKGNTIVCLVINGKEAEIKNYLSQYQIERKKNFHLGMIEPQDLKKVFKQKERDLLLNQFRFAIIDKNLHIRSYIQTFQKGIIEIPQTKKILHYLNNENK